MAHRLSSHDRLTEILQSLQHGHQMVIAFHKPENPVTYLCLKVLTGSRNAVTRSDSVVGCARTYSYLNFRFIGGQ
jgi:hypothetical protein